ncbi:MAG TPA: 16S rRNA (cytosine(967)-C(5))-methyltransferase RsmB [Firmicutes bacterium]|nr:16S rRNA (cytosine(967)-C(5))-methyltransferase RsmB [Bacillota bacterium]
MKKVTNPRQLAVLTLNGYDKTEDFLREVLNLRLGQSNLSAADQVLYTELVYGTVRMQKNLDYILSIFSRRPLEKVPRLILYNLRLAVYQIMYLDRVPDFAAVNEAVNLARRFGHQGTVSFTNGVLRQVVKNKGNIVYPSAAIDLTGHLAVKYSYPRWIIQHWLAQLGSEETERLCRAMNRSPEMQVRVNTLRATREEVQAHLLEAGITVLPGRYAPDVLRVSPAQLVIRSSWLAAGKFYIQGESSALAAHALGAKPDMTVYDLCSAPGGKATHLAQLMGNQGKILALDANRARLGLVRENAERLGVSIISTLQADARREQPLPQADAVLVDAPCSGLGTMRQRPDIRWRKSKNEIEGLVAVQKAILKQAAAYVRPGGVLLYSTCTLTSWENQEVAHSFLEENAPFAGAALPAWFPQTEKETPWMRTFWPHLHGLDGFFVSLFRKRET